ncbi:MAG: hypothetical protein R6V50_07935 [Thermoplasmatota archaeon]
MASKKKHKDEDIEKLHKILDNPFDPKTKENVGKNDSQLESLRLRLASDSSNIHKKSKIASQYKQNPDLLKPQVDIYEAPQEKEKKPDIQPTVTQKQDEKREEQKEEKIEEKISEPELKNIQELLEKEDLIEIEKVDVPVSEFLEVKQKIDEKPSKEKKELIYFSNQQQHPGTIKEEPTNHEDFPLWQSVEEQSSEEKDSTSDEKKVSDKSLPEFLQIKSVDKKPEQIQSKEEIPQNQMDTDKALDEQQKNHQLQKSIKDKTDDTTSEEQIIKKTTGETQEEIVEWQPIDDHDRQETESNNNQESIKEPVEDIDLKITAEEQSLKDEQQEKEEEITEWQPIDETSDEEEKDQQDEEQTKESEKTIPESSKTDLYKDKDEPTTYSKRKEEIYINEFLTEKSPQDQDSIQRGKKEEYAIPSSSEKISQDNEQIQDRKTKKQLLKEEKQELKKEKKMRRLQEKERKQKERNLLKQKRKQKEIKTKEPDIGVDDEELADFSEDIAEGADIQSTEVIEDKKTFTKIDDSLAGEQKEPEEQSPHVDRKKFKVKDKKKPKKKKTKKTKKKPEEEQEIQNSSSNTIIGDESYEWESFPIDEKDESKPIAEAAYTYGEFVLYKKEVRTATGRKKPIHFFSKTIPDIGKPVKLPEGYEVRIDKKTGLPYLKKT